MSDLWNSIVRITPDVLHQELGGETVLLNLANESYFGLNEVGTRIWQVLAETNSANDVIKCLVDEYEVSEDQLRIDVEKLIGELVAGGLLTVGPAP